MSTNGVRHETVRAADLTAARTELALVVARRQLNGDWSVELELDVELTLPDGRRLVAKRPLNVRAAQRGRKARRPGKGGAA